MSPHLPSHLENESELSEIDSTYAAVYFVYAAPGHTGTFRGAFRRTVSGTF